MGQHGGDGLPAPEANGMPWMAGRVERRSGSEWAVLFPTGGAGTPAFPVAAFPSELQAQQSLQLLRSHVLLCAFPSLPLDQVPSELQAAMQTDDGQFDEDFVAELRDITIDQLVSELRQNAAEMAAAAAADAVGGGSSGGLAAAGAAVEPPAAQTHSTGSAAPGPTSAAGPAAAATGAAEEPRQLPSSAAALPQPPLLTQHKQQAVVTMHPPRQPPQQEAQGQQPPQHQEEHQPQGQQHPQQQQEQQALGQQHPQQQEEQHPQGPQPLQQQLPVAPQRSTTPTAVSGDASASDYLGVRPAPSGCGGWLAEVSVLLGPAGLADPGGRRQRQAVPVASELEAALARDLALVWQEAWSGPSSPQPLCNFPFKRYCQDARVWAILCELPCWRDLAAYLAQLQEDGFLLKAAQAYDAGSLPQGWPEPAAQPAGGAPPAAQHPAHQRGDGDGGSHQGLGGRGPPRANGRAGGGISGMGRPGAPAGRGTKRKAGAPAAADHGQRQRGWPAGSASGYPGVYRRPGKGGWYGKMKPPGERWACDVLWDHDVRVVAVGHQLALFWATLVSPGQPRPALQPALRDSFMADAELMRQLGTADEAAEMRKLVRQLQRAGRLHQWCHLLPPALTSSCPPQQAQAEAPTAAADQADSSAGASAAAAEEGAEATGPAAARSAGSSAALDALAAVAAAAPASSPSAGAPPAWPCKEHRLQSGPPGSQGASEAAAPAAARAQDAPAPLPSGWEAQAAAWQQLSQRQAEAWAGSLQPESLDMVMDSWSGEQAMAATSPLALPTMPPGSTGAAAAERSSPSAEEVEPQRAQQHMPLLSDGCGAPQQAAGAHAGARVAPAGAGQVPRGWQVQAAAWQQTSRHAAERWEASMPPAVPSWLTDNAQLHGMLLPGEGAQPAGQRRQQAAAPSAAGLAEPRARLQLQRPPQQQVLTDPSKPQHRAAPAQPDQQPQQPEGSATTACTSLVWQPAAQAAGIPAAASAGAASPSSPSRLHPGGAPAPLVATPAGSVLASLPAPAAARLQLLLARLPIEGLPEEKNAGRGSPPYLTHQQQMQQAPQAVGGDVLLYCRKTNGLAGLPLVERLLVVEARREGGPGLGPKASQQHCECLLLASGPSDAHMTPPEPPPPGASSGAVAAALSRVALLSRTAFKQNAVAVRSARQWRPVGRVQPERFAEVLAALSPRQE